MASCTVCVSAAVEKEQTVFSSADLKVSLVPKIHEVLHRKRTVIASSAIPLVEGFEKDRLKGTA
jgi:hypothetical protein